MKIVMIEPSGKGAMVHYVFQLARAMATEGADVVLITGKNCELAAVPHAFTLDSSIEVWDAKPSGRQSQGMAARTWRKVRRAFRAVRYYTEWLRLIRRVDTLNADVIQLGDIRFPTDYFPLRLLRRRARVFADICHNVRPYARTGTFERSVLRQAFYRRAYALFDHVFVHFERNRREFLATFAVPESRVTTIVLGNEEIFVELADPRIQPEALRERHGIARDQDVVLFFGTLSKYKGTDLLLRAFPRIHAETGARLVVAGFPAPGFDLEAQKRLARDTGIEPAVTWVAEYIPMGEVAAWMRLASVIVFPYRDVYQSAALHLAQTFGVPIVATAAGTISDVMEHEVSGLLVPVDDVTALSSAALRLLRDRDLAARLGARAARDALERFSWRAIARTLLRAYGQTHPR
ncbi:MAG: glycosyltransferase family 4 protein [Thermoanaerobaculia bacterium]